MAPQPFDPGSTANALIVSEVCFLRESLAEILTRAGIRVGGQSGTLAHALAIAAAGHTDIVLLDVAFPSAIAAAMSLAAALPHANVIALAIAETEENVLAWAEAGIAGYVPNTASVDDLVSLILQIRRGEQTCPKKIVGSLLRRLGAERADRTGRAAEPALAMPMALTRRELEISRLIATGLSNKDIARRLGISLGTTKSHVHNLLGKLSLQRRAEVMVRMNAPR
jgi:two-component system, NarL family, nitrate/nitrite response regulator NarL